GKYADLREYHVATADMNPSINASWFDQQEDADPPSFRREYLALFESGFGAVFAAQSVREAVIGGLRELSPEGVTRYAISLDAAFSGDLFAAIIGHRDGPRLDIDRILG